MSKEFDVEESLLLDMLALTFSGKTKEELEGAVKSLTDKAAEIKRIDWNRIVDIADRHSVLPLLYDVLDSVKGLPAEAKFRFKSVSDTTVLQNYRLLFLCRTIIKLLKNEKIDAVILKGCGTGGFYPVPELRKSGDIDLLLLDKADIDKTEEVLADAGFEKTKVQLANHHVSFSSKEGIEIEVHIMLVEPFDNNRTNRFLKEIYDSCREHVCKKETMGIMIPVLEDGYHAFHLLLHMLQDLLRSGFGLKLLCDWVAFWRVEKDTQCCQTFMELLEESGLVRFSKIITAACVGYLGLPADKVSFMFGRTLTTKEAVHMGRDFIMEVLEAEEFGKSSSDRMVMVRGSGIAGYIREFHHQMHLNFPKSGKIFICWPVLWTVTLIKFLNNNRKIRKTSTRAILKKAGARSRLMRDLQLFK